MSHRCEVLFPTVDTGALQVGLQNAGAIPVFARRLLTRKIFDGDALPYGTWVRLRTEGLTTTLLLWRPGGAEVETIVEDFEATATILRATGLREVRHQQVYREKWQLGDTEFVLEDWPGLPSLLNVAAPDESAARISALRLGLDWARARSGGVVDLYQSELGRDIRLEPTLLFDRVN